MNRFAGKTVIVTGAASGIGAASARRVHSEGGTVIALDLRREELDRFANEFPDLRRIQTFAIDVTDHDQVAALVDVISNRHDDLWGLVNSAGVRSVGTLLNISHAEWKRALDVNLDGTFNTCQAFAKSLSAKGRGGAIVNISSTAGIVPVANRLGYVAAKMGVSGITRAMCLELGAVGIRVNAIAPGIIRTPMAAGMLEDPANAERIRTNNPLGRVGEPEDIASGVAYLLSEDSGFINGVILAVDGGHTAGKPSY